MNDIESRLADAMAARAQEVEPQDADDALSRISERVNMNRRRGLTVLGIAAALMIVVGAVALLQRDDKGQKVNVASDSGTTTTANTTPASVIPSEPIPIWPFASMNRTFATPEEAAKSFAIDYLGMTKAQVGKTTGGDVEIFPNDRASLRTVVHLEEQPPRGWVVLSAAADMIVVDTPAVHDPLRSPLAVSGRSLAFEAQINLQLRPYGSITPVFESFTMGGGTEVLPFSTTIAPPSTDQPLVLVIFEGDASGEGTMSQATVLALAAAGPPEPSTFVGRTTAGDLRLFDFAGHEQRPATENDMAGLTASTTLPSGVDGSLPTLRGRFGTIAFFDGTNISSYNPAASATVKLVEPAAKPISLDADESGRFLLWVDANHDLWKWSGADPVKVGSGFNSAAW